MQSKQKSVQQAQQQAHDHGRAGLQVAHPHQDLGQPQQDAAVREHLRQELRKHRDQASGMKSAQEEQACITSQMRKQAMMDEETASQQQALLALQQQQLQQHPDVQFLHYDFSLSMFKLNTKIHFDKSWDIIGFLTCSAKKKRHQRPSCLPHRSGPYGPNKFAVAR